MTIEGLCHGQLLGKKAGVCDVVVATCSPVLSSDVCLVVLRTACSLDLTWGISSLFSRSGEVRSHVPAMANLPKSPVAGLPTSVALGYLRRLDVNSGHRCNSLLGDRPLSDARQTYLSVEVRVECPRFRYSEIASPRSPGTASLRCGAEDGHKGERPRPVPRCGSSPSLHRSG